MVLETKDFKLELTFLHSNRTQPIYYERVHTHAVAINPFGVHNVRLLHIITKNFPISSKLQNSLGWQIADVNGQMWTVQ